MVDELADAGADLGWLGRNNQAGGETALHAAAKYGHAGAVRSLAARGDRAAVDARGHNNRTSLHEAACFGRTAAVQVLLEAGAGASLKSGSGKTALDYALEERSKQSNESDEQYAAIFKGKPEVDKLLRDHATAEPEPTSVAGAGGIVAMMGGTQRNQGLTAKRGEFVLDFG